MSLIFTRSGLPVRRDVRAVESFLMACPLDCSPPSTPPRGGCVERLFVSSRRRLDVFLPFSQRVWKMDVGENPTGQARWPCTGGRVVALLSVRFELHSPDVGDSCHRPTDSSGWTKTSNRFRPRGLEAGRVLLGVHRTGRRPRRKIKLTYTHTYNLSRNFFSKF